jgi:enoyl-CoA hydratase/carnithine racemase
MTEQATEQLVTVNKKGRVGNIVMSRKGNNSIAPDLGEALEKALGELEQDPEVRVIVIRSAYEKYFSVGADLGNMAQVDRGDKAAVKKATRDSVGYLQAVFTRIEKSPKVTIAAINGHALGGGCELSLACDYRIMVDDDRATIGQTEVNLGIIPGAGGTQRLPRVVGRAKALEMMLEGLRINARDALRIGLVHEAPKPEEFEDAVKRKAEKLAAGAPVAQTLIKQAVNDGLGKERIEDALEVEMDAFTESVLTEDAVIGIMAFFSKQTPEFTGK